MNKILCFVGAFAFGFSFHATPKLSCLETFSLEAFTDNNDQYSQVQLRMDEQLDVAVEVLEDAFNKISPFSFSILQGLIAEWKQLGEKRQQQFFGLLNVIEIILSRVENRLPELQGQFDALKLDELKLDDLKFLNQIIPLDELMALLCDHVKISAQEIAAFLNSDFANVLPDSKPGRVTFKLNMTVNSDLSVEEIFELGHAGITVLRHISTVENILMGRELAAEDITALAGAIITIQQILLPNRNLERQSLIRRRLSDQELARLVTVDQLQKFLADPSLLATYKAQHKQFKANFDNVFATASTALDRNIFDRQLAQATRVISFAGNGKNDIFAIMFNAWKSLKKAATQNSKENCEELIKQADVFLNAAEQALKSFREDTQSLNNDLIAAFADMTEAHRDMLVNVMIEAQQ